MAKERILMRTSWAPVMVLFLILLPCYYITESRGIGEKDAQHKGFHFLRWDGFVSDRNLIAASYAAAARHGRSEMIEVTGQDAFNSRNRCYF